MKRCIWFEQTKIEYEWIPKRVKNLNLRVKANGEVVASSPFFVSGEEMDRFIVLHGGYILSAKNRLAEQGRFQKELADEKKNFVWILGERYPIRVIPSCQNRVAFEDKELVLFLKNTEDLGLRARVLDSYLEEICRKQTRYFCQKWYPYFEEFCDAFPEVSYRKMRSRWGSCNAQKGKILLNKRLAHVPSDCIEYVICHELTHFIYPNHSADFYRALADRMPDWKERKKRLVSFESLVLF